MLISPLIDLLVIVGTGFLTIGSVLKAVDVATRYQPSLLGFSSVDFLLMTAVCWGFSLVLAARTWVQLNEPLLMRRRRERMQQEARWRVAGLDYADEGAPGADDEDVQEAAGGER